MKNATHYSYFNDKKVGSALDGCQITLDVEIMETKGYVFDHMSHSMTLTIVLSLCYV